MRHFEPGDGVSAAQTFDGLLQAPAKSHADHVDLFAIDEIYVELGRYFPIAAMEAVLNAQSQQRLAAVFPVFDTRCRVELPGVAVIGERYREYPCIDVTEGVLDNPADPPARIQPPLVLDAEREAFIT